MIQNIAEKYPHLRDYWRIIYKRKYVVFACFISIVIVMCLFNLRQTPTYQASCKFMIEYYSVEVEPIPTKVMTLKRGQAYPQYYDVQYEIIKGREVAELAAKILGWDKQEMGMEGAIEKLQASTSVRPFGGRASGTPTNIAYIISRDADPKTAMDMANAVARAYIQQKAIEEQEGLDLAQRAFNEQIVEARRKLEASEIDLDEYKRKAGIITTIDDNKDINEKILAEFNISLVKAQTKRVEKEIFLESLKKMLPSDKVMALSVVAERTNTSGDSNLVNIGLKKQLFETQQQLKNMALKYRDKHPEIIRLKNDIEGIRKEINDEVERVIRGLELEVQTLKAQEETLLARMKKTDTSSTDNIEYLSLSRDAEVNKDI